MTKPLTGKEPAYPTYQPTHEKRIGDIKIETVWGLGGGIPIRLHLAAMAMQGMLTSGEFLRDVESVIADRALRQADALIAAYNKEQE